MSLYSEIPKLSWQELIDRWSSHRPEETGIDDGYLDEVALEARRRGDVGVRFLTSQLDHPDGVRVIAAILGLTSPPLEDSALPRTLRKRLSDPRPLVVAAAIRGLDQLARADVLSEIRPRVEDRSPYVRCAALEFVRRHDPKHAESTLLSALTDGAYLVRMCAADELDELGDPSVVPHLRPLLADPHPDVRQAAETTIANLAGRATAKAQAGAAG